MPQQFRFNVKDQQSGETRKVPFEIPDEEWDQLVEFSRYAEQLETSGVISKGINVRTIVRGDMTSKSLSYECILPSDDDTAVLLHRLRPFVLRKERTCFYRICNVLHQRLECDELRAAIDYQRKGFSGKDFQSQVTIKMNETVVNSEAMLMRWLNAHEYHRDPTKQQELEMLRDWFPDSYSKGLFISMLIDKARSVINIGRFIRWMARRDESAFSFSPQSE